LDDRTALLTNVLDAPADDTARLVLADWLEEHGEEPLGRFARAGVLAARYRRLEALDAVEYYDAIRTINDVATAGAPARWLSADGIAAAPLPDPGWMWDHEGDRVAVRVGVISGVFTRGLLSELVLPLEHWYERAVRALAVWPLERATISNEPGLTFWIDPPDADHPEWRMSAAFTVQPQRRQRGLIRGLFGGDERPPVPVGRWSAERSFPDRAALVQMSAHVWPVLFDEVRDAAGAQWTLTPR
jgi:uncharacterized protein (TIGR02996 family)